MEPSYIGAIWMFGGNFAPANFAFCDGRLIAISINDALYSLLGTTYGGDGQSTFALPDLRGRVAVGQGQGPGLSNYVIGQVAGTESVTITSSTMAAHTHAMNVGSAAGTAQVPANTLYLTGATDGTAAVNMYSNATANATLVGSTIGAAGNSIPIEILQPIGAVSYLMALYGIYPTQN